MSTLSPMTLERALYLYSVEADEWWDGCAEGDQMLGVREWIEAHFDQLNEDQVRVLRALDERVVGMAEGFPVAASWDVSMLKQTASLALSHYQSA